jgi:uncharacterized protein (DUF3820 family)
MKPTDKKRRIVEIVEEALKHRGWSVGETNQIIARLMEYGPDVIYDTANGLTWMPFGKYKGVRIRDIPSEYLQWIYSQEWFEDRFEKLHKETREILEAREAEK